MESLPLPSNSSASTDGTDRNETAPTTTSEASPPPTADRGAVDCVPLPTPPRTTAEADTTGTAAKATRANGTGLEQPGLAEEEAQEEGGGGVRAKPCSHNFVENPEAGEMVCILCGQVGEQILSPPMPAEEDMHAQDPLPRLARELSVRNELYEVVSRLSGGDVASVHVERAMGLLQILGSDASWLDPPTRDMIRRLGIKEGLDRGIMAVVLHRALEENGRKEDIELVGEQCGASKADVLHAEKILEMGRGYTQNSAVKVGIVLNTQQLRDLPASWLRTICEALATATEEAFCDIDSLVCAVGVCLARNIKAAISMVPKANKKYVDRSGMAPHLSLLTVKRMAGLYGVSPGSVRRAMDNLSGAVRECLWTKGKNLVMFFEPHQVQKIKLQAAFAAGKRKALKDCTCMPKKREFKGSQEEENWD